MVVFFAFDFLMEESDSINWYLLSSKGTGDIIGSTYTAGLMFKNLFGLASMCRIIFIRLWESAKHHHPYKQ